MEDSEGATLKVTIKGTKQGLGIRIVGGRMTEQDSMYGIFIKEIIRNSLADINGRLKRGDQLLEANGRSLIGVSNAKAVEILKACAMTNEIAIKISRDSKSQKDFHRLSGSTDNAPKATSTPRGADPVTDTGASQNGHQDGKEPDEDEAKRFSTSSELTQVTVSTTDLSSHGDELEIIDQKALSKNLQKYAVDRSQTTSIALSDVVVEMEHEGDTGEFPPPIPNSSPPSLEMEDISPKKHEVAMGAAGSAVAGVILRNRTSPEGRTMSPPLSATSLSSPHCVTHTFVIPKEAGLGIIIGGGVGKSDGPHIIIDRIIDGMDAAKDGNLKQGDRILSINGEDFCNQTRERVLAFLSQLRKKRDVTNFNVTVERMQESLKHSGPPSSLPSPKRTANSSIFDSDTLLASEAAKVKSPHGESLDSLRVSPSKKSAPNRYSGKKNSDRRKGKHDSMHNRLSMDPSARVKLEKLEWALKYMGHNITPQKQKELHLSLDIDGNGKVMFKEFAKVACEMFALKLDNPRLETNLMLALTQKDYMDMPFIPRKSTSYEHIWDQNLMEMPIKPASSQPILPLSTSFNSAPSDEEIDQMRHKLHKLGYNRDKENEAMKRELEREKELTAKLKKELKLKEREFLEAKMSNSTLSQEDTEILLNRIKMTEEAHKAERDKSNRLEDSIREKDAELQVLREHQPQITLDEARRSLAIVENELRKEKLISRRHQVAVERLMQFVEHCHEALVKSPEANCILYHPHGKGLSVQRGNKVTGNPRPPQFLSRHAKRTSTKLAQEAQETMAAVRKMLETEVLPHGWEEAYTEEGQKYYINHETQVTSWVHPVTKVAANSYRGDSRSSTQSIVSGNTTPTLSL